MSLFFQIMFLRWTVFLNLKESVKFEYLNKDFFNRCGCRIKFDRSTSEPVINPISGKVLYHKPHYNSLTITLFKGGVVVDQWKGNTLYTYDSSGFQDLHKNKTLKKIKYMGLFYAKFAKIILETMPKKS